MRWQGRRKRTLPSTIIQASSLLLCLATIACHVSSGMQHGQGTQPFSLKPLSDDNAGPQPSCLPFQLDEWAPLTLVYLGTGWPGTSRARLGLGARGLRSSGIEWKQMARDSCDGAQNTEGGGGVRCR